MSRVDRCLQRGLFPRRRVLIEGLVDLLAEAELGDPHVALGRFAKGCFWPLELDLSYPRDDARRRRPWSGDEIKSEFVTSVLKLGCISGRPERVTWIESWSMRPKCARTLAETACGFCT